MGADVDRNVSTCLSCAKNNSKYFHRRKLQLFPAPGPLNFVEIQIVGNFSTTTQSSQFILAITNKYTKQTRAIPTSLTTAPHIANILGSLARLSPHPDVHLYGQGYSICQQMLCYDVQLPWC